MTTRYFWQSSDPNVLSIPDYWNTAYVTANSGGSSDISFYVTDGSCGAGGDATGTVADQTPVVAGIDPSDWPSDGTTHQVTFTGQNFGTNTPTLSFDPSDGISYSLVSWNDSTIIANITVASGTPDADVNVSVTSNGYNGLGFTSGGTGASPTGPPALASIRGGNTPKANISINFCLSPQQNCPKSADDSRPFTGASGAWYPCSEFLGLQSCSRGYFWNIEGKGIVSDDATNWTVNQTVVSGRLKGVANDGRFTPIDNSITNQPDGPLSNFLQETPGQHNIYWIDAPGYKATDMYSMTLIYNFKTEFCSTVTSNDCFSINWYTKIVVKPGGALDVKNSAAGLGSLSTNF